MVLNRFLTNRVLTRASESRQAGFTLIELLLVVIIAGVLAAIAAPGWLAFANNQRVSTANKELLQLLREAQTEAIAKRTTYGIKLDPNEPDGPPSVTKFTAKDQGSAAGNFAELSTEVLGNETEATGLKLRTIPNNASNEYRFDFNGSVMETDFITMADQNTDYKYKIEVSKQGARRCVIVETLLGAMSEGSGDECDP